MRVVRLGVGHRPTLEPTIEHFIDSPQNSLVLLRRNSDVVDELSVDVADILHSRQLLQLLHRPHAHHLLIVIAHPDRNWVAPHTVSTEAPVLSLRQPIVKSLFLSKFRHPCRLLVVL